MKNGVILKMKPVCECGYVFENLTLTKIKMKSSGITVPLFSYRFEPGRCPGCGKAIDCVTTPLINEMDGVTIFAKKEENHAE